jgi:hypothetical protein
MTREPGAREKALREMREAAFADNQSKLKAAMPRLKAIDKLVDAVAVASKKRGKPRKGKK